MVAVDEVVYLTIAHKAFGDGHKTYNVSRRIRAVIQSSTLCSTAILSRYLFLQRVTGNLIMGGDGGWGKAPIHNA